MAMTTMDNNGNENGQQLQWMSIAVDSNDGQRKQQWTVMAMDGNDG